MNGWLTREVSIRNRLGLHARAASLLVRTASGFHADIFLEKDGVRANAKSIMGLLMLAAAMGTRMILTASGDDAEPALDALAKLIEVDRFNEP